MLLAALLDCCIAAGIQGLDTAAAAIWLPPDPHLSPRLAAPCPRLPVACPLGPCLQETVRFSFQGGTYSLGQLLPMRFRPADLLPDPAPPLLLQPQDNGIQLTPAARQLLQERTGDAAFVRAAAEALQEAVGSYSPYSRCPAGVAIVTADGDVYSGGYVESAAFNPSLPPLQTAIIDAVIGGQLGWDGGVGVCGWGGGVGWGGGGFSVAVDAQRDWCSATLLLQPPSSDPVPACPDMSAQMACPATQRCKRWCLWSWKGGRYSTHTPPASSWSRLRLRPG